MAKRILIRIAIVCFGILLALAMLEAGLRVWVSTRGTERQRIMYLYDRATIDSKVSQFIGAPFLNYTLNPNQDDVNDRGIRGGLVEVPKPEGVYRIVALGGSTTFGIGLEAREAWPFQLQSILINRYGYKNVQVVNLGVPGYYSLNSVVNLATRGLALEPDLVINYDGVNDAIIRIYENPTCYQGDTPLFGLGMDQGVWQSGGAELPPSALYRVLAIRLGWMEDPTALSSRMTPTGWCPAPTEDGNFLDRLAKNPPVYFERNLRSVAALARSGGAQTLFMTFAWDSAAAKEELAADPSLDGTRALLDAIDTQNALLPVIADDMEALYVDLASQMDDSAYFQGDHVHQTAQGAQRQAEILAAFLDAQGAIPR